MDMRCPTDAELADDNLPHVFFTADMPWDPTVLDNEHDPEELIENLDPDAFLLQDRRVNVLGEYCPRQAHHTATERIHAPPARLLLPKNLDHKALLHNFGWFPVDRIRKTLDCTTQFYRATGHHPFRKHFRSRFPAAYVRRLQEWYATDTFF